MRLTSLVVAALIACGPGATAAAAQDSGGATGTIRGTVYDSLLRSPLIGAEIWVVGTSRSTLSDKRGQYTLDSVPAGARVVAFGRPDLDSIGLSSFAARVTVGPNTVVNLPLGVPSHDTYWRAACGTSRSRASDDSGLVFGTVTDAETRTRLAGARVRVGWLAVRYVRQGRKVDWLMEHPARDVATDSTGAYYVCGAPVEFLLTARAYAGPFASGTAETIVDIRGVARRDLTLSREVPLGLDSTQPAIRLGLASVAGTVVGERGGVLPGSLVSVDDVADTVKADSAGRFVLRNLPSGTQMLMVRRIGYFAHRAAVDLRNRDTTRVDVTLSQATVLDTLRVTAAPLQTRVIEGIDERRRTGFGYLLGPAEVRQRPSMRSLFDGVPSTHVEGSPVNFTLWFGAGAGFCRAQVYIDGWAADDAQLQDMTPSQILAVEVYPRQTASLGRFLSVWNGCGVVLVWTKWAR